MVQRMTCFIQKKVLVQICLAKIFPTQRMVREPESEKLEFLYRPRLECRNAVGTV